MKEFAAEMGVTYWNLKDWKRRYSAPPEPRSGEELEAELLRLRRENESLKTQRDVLKKALGILVEPPSSATRG
jgi:transposase